MTQTQTPIITFHTEKDDYGRTVHRVVAGEYRYSGDLIGAIVRLPKRTYPVTTYMVNDYRVTRQPGRGADVVHVSTLREAKAMFSR